MALTSAHGADDGFGPSAVHAADRAVDGDLERPSVEPYNLRASPEYEKTRLARVTIGERREPAPNGVPGYLRIDTVGRFRFGGDGPDGEELYYLNAVDEVTQREVVSANPKAARSSSTGRSRTC